MRQLNTLLLLVLLLLCGCGSDSGLLLENSGASPSLAEPETGTAPGTTGEATSLSLRLELGFLGRSLPEGQHYIRGNGLVEGQSVYEQVLPASPVVIFENVPLNVETFRLEFFVEGELFGVYSESINVESLQSGLYTISEPTWDDPPVAVKTLQNISQSRMRNLSVIDENTLWLAGDDGALLKSTDGGQTFEYQVVGTELDLFDVHFLDSQHGWLVAADNQVFTTVDGGENWSLVTVAPDNTEEGPLHKLFAVWFVSPTRGAVGGDYDTFTSVGGILDRAVLFNTLNGGTDWSTGYQEPFTTNTTILDFAGTGSVMYACGGDALLLKSEDEGESWLRRSTGLSQRLRGVDFRPDNLQGYTLSNGRIFYTTNGASTWSSGSFSISGNKRLRSVAAVDEDVAVAVGGPNDGSGLFLRTTDGGANWSRIDGIPEAQYQDVEFVNENVGFAVSEDGVVLRSDDGGLSWSVSYDPFVELTDDLFGVDFTDSQFGAIVGAGGLLMRTDDGGQTFLSSVVGNGRDLFCVDFATENLGWAAGDRGEIWQTLNGGDDWFLSYTGFVIDSRTLRDLQAVTPQILYAVGDADGASVGTVLKSEDGGRIWNPLDTGLASGSFFGVSFSDEDSGLVVGAGGQLVASNDGGATWMTRNSGTSVDLRSVFFHPNGQLAVVVGDDGTILRSADGGESWVAAAVETTKNLVSVDFSTELSGLIAGFDGTLLQTSDGGLSWMPMNFNFPYNFTAVHLNLDTSGFVIGRNGGLVRLAATNEEFLPIPVANDTNGNLGIISQPAEADIFATLEPIVVETGGEENSTREVAVSLEVVSGDDRAELSGTLQQQSYNGRATFDDLSVDRRGTYRLVFQSPGLGEVRSDEFSLTDSSFGRFVGTGSGQTFDTFFNIAEADGDVEPDRSLVGPNAQGSKEVAVDVVRNEVYGLLSTQVKVYNLNASGTANVKRTILGFSFPADLQFDTNARRLFILDSFLEEVHVIDNGGVGDRRVISGLTNPRAIRYVPEDDRLFVLSSSGFLTVLDQASQAEGDVSGLSARVVSGLIIGSDSFDYWSQTDSVYIASLGQVYVIEGASEASGPAGISRSMTFPSVFSKKVVLDPVREIMYLLDPNNEEIEAYNGYTTLSGPITPDRVIEHLATDGQLVRMDY